jgi:hypothetical protein
VKPVKNWRIGTKRKNYHDDPEFAFHVTARFYLTNCLEHHGDDGSGRHYGPQAPTASSA